mgnify:CR=1 FL=1
MASPIPSPAAGLRDLVTGLSVAGLMLPEAIAYAGIAGLPPGRALLAGVAGGLAYALVGRSRFAIVSPTSSSAAILAAALASLPGGAAAAGANATALVACVGIIFALLAMFRSGNLAGFVSRPVLRGFAFGLAVTIIVRQVPKLVGVSAAGGSVWSVLDRIAGQAGAWNWLSLALGLGALLALLAARRWPRVPGTLLVIAGGIALTELFALDQRGVALAGRIALALPRLDLPADPGEWARLMQLAAPVALILFAESWGTIRNLALRHGDEISANRELGALSLANLAAAAAQGMPVGAGFSAGSANEAAGASTRLAGACAAAALALLALFAAPLIARIPEPVLAAVVIAALSHALSPAPILRLFRIGRDHWFALAALIGVLVLGVLDGMLLAVGLSILHLLYDLARPSISELGRVGQSHDFVDIARHQDARRIEGIAIFRPNAPLVFANAETALAAIASAARRARARSVVLSLEESDDLDSTGIDALGEFAEGLRKAGQRVILARAHDRVREVLQRAGLGDLARDATYSVADAAALAAEEEISQWQ